MAGTLVAAQGSADRRSDGRRSPAVDLRWAAQLALLLVPLAFLAVMAWDHRWTADDGFINLRIVKQILAGNGPVFNVGDRVEAGTSPLWLGVLGVLDAVTPIRLEWIAVVAGLAATVGGLAFAILGTQRALAAIRPGRRTFLPLGALVYAVIPPAWDFATSGLETGLSIFWLGAVWWCLCRRAVATHRVEGLQLASVAALTGLGPLIRPDFLVFSAFFVVALLTMCDRRPRVVAVVVASALALPVVVQLFRMAYFAALVPNTALAKEATRSDWAQGWRYVTNFGGGFRIYVPLVLLLVIAAFELRGAGTTDGVAFRRLTLLVVASALAQAVFVTRVGGDFMVGRMLLPALFVALAPVAVVAVESAATAIVAGLVVVWAISCAGWLRPPAISRPSSSDPSTWIIDERAYYAALAGAQNPVTLDDYEDTDLVRNGRYAHRLADDGRGVLVLNALFRRDQLMPIRPDSPVPVVADVGPMGLYGYAAGLDVNVVDAYGLSDSTASHQRLEHRGRPGHEKSRVAPWVIAEHADPAAPIPAVVHPRDVIAARHALTCGKLAVLVRDRGAPLGIGQVARNLIDSIGLTTFRFSADPREAELELCGRRR